MKEALSSSETSVFTSATWRNILEDATRHRHRRENLKSYRDLKNYDELKHAFVRDVLQLAVTANIVPSSPILITLIMEAIRSSEIAFLTTATRHHIPESGFLHSHRREILKSYLHCCVCSDWWNIVWRIVG
jgi:hypothetical protein